MKVCGEVAPSMVAFAHGERTHAHAGTRFVDGQAQTDSRGHRAITDGGGGGSQSDVLLNQSAPGSNSPRRSNTRPGRSTCSNTRPRDYPPLQLFSSDVVDSPKCCSRNGRDYSNKTFQRQTLRLDGQVFTAWTLLRCVCVCACVLVIQRFTLAFFRRLLNLSLWLLLILYSGKGAEFLFSFGSFHYSLQSVPPFDPLLDTVPQRLSVAREMSFFPPQRRPLSSAQISD